MVPEGWKHTCLNNICDTVTSGSRDWAQYYSESGSKFIRMTNLQRENIHLNLSDLKFVNVQSDSSDGKRTSLRPDDILMSITAELGKIGLVHEGLGEAYINQHTALIRLNSDRAYSEYIAYLLSSKEMNHRINKLNDSGAKAGLNLPTIRSIPIYLPPLSEQRKIAKILGTWDKAIATTEKLIEASKQQKKTLMQQLLTGKKRFAGFEGEWKTVKLKNLIKSLDSGVSVNSVEDQYQSEYFILKTSCVSSGEFDASEVKKVIDYKEICRLKEPLLNDSIVLSRMNTPKLVGANSYIDKAPSKTFLPDRLWQVKTYPNKVNMRWLAFWLGSAKTRSALSDLASGTSGSMKNISKSAVLNICLELPSIDEQKKIAETLTVHKQEIENLQTKLAHLKQEKKALMQQLLTGKRRVTPDTEEETV